MGEIGQKGAVLSDVLIKVFGERNCATRATIRMIDLTEGLTGAGHPGVPHSVLKAFSEEEEVTLEHFKDAWKKIYREAIKDQRHLAAGPVGGWKHTAPDFHSDFQTNGVKVLFLVRNPYSWILSLKRRPYHMIGPRRKELFDFLSTPWMTVGRDNLDKILSSPIDLWSLKLGAYQRFMSAAQSNDVPCAIMRFEDFTHDPVAALTEAIEVVTGRIFPIQELEESTKRDGVRPEERRAYYANELWRADLTKNTVALINARVDWDIAAQFGYERLDPEEFPERLPDELQPIA